MHSIYGLYYNDDDNIEHFNNQAIQDNIKEVIENNMIDKYVKNQDKDDENNSNNISNEQNNNHNYAEQNNNNNVCYNKEKINSDNLSNDIQTNNDRKNEEIFLNKTRKRSTNSKGNYSNIKYSRHIYSKHKKYNSTKRHRVDNNNDYIGKDFNIYGVDTNEFQLHDNLTTTNNNGNDNNVTQENNYNNNIINIEEGEIFDNNKSNIKHNTINKKNKKEQIFDMMYKTKEYYRQYIINIFNTNKYCNVINKIFNNSDQSNNESIEFYATFLNKCIFTLQKIRNMLHNEVNKTINNKININDVFDVLNCASAQYNHNCCFINYCFTKKPTFATKYSDITIKNKDFNNNIQLRDYIDFILNDQKSLVRTMLIDFNKIRYKMNRCTKFNNISQINIKLHDN